MRWERALLGIALLAASAGLTGCVLMELSKVRQTEERQAEYAFLAGTVRSAGSPETDSSAREEDAEWMVVYILTVPCDEDWRALKEQVERGEFRRFETERTSEEEARIARLRSKIRLADHMVRQRPGFWYMRVAPGCYGVGAFLDRNRNSLHDEGEPMAPATETPDRLLELKGGDRREGVDLVIEPGVGMVEGFDAEVRPVDEFTFRSHEAQLIVSLGEVMAVGEVADLSEPRFGPEGGRLGYYDIYRFLWEVRPGVYFLEPYDPDRIPVLFVHGALGYPREFASLIDHLDRTRYQPWVAVYPSGSRLDSVADYLSRNLADLQYRHGFREMAVVAHSMGGLVSRSFILRHHEAVVNDPVKVFVSISTPWSGVPSASAGVEQSPYVVPSWRDVSPTSEYLADLFFEDPEAQTVPRRLPEQVAYYLIFGVEDQTVPIPSEVRWEAVRDARERWPLIYDHTHILESPEAAQLLNEILSRELP